MEDCYFFYNSECSKGPSCPFRHEPLALHSGVVCSFWRQGNCSKLPCPYRHAEPTPQTSRQSSIPCYWESQPGGCRKTSCPFLHSGPALPTSPAAGPKIIVNKTKINEIGALLAQKMEAERIVIPASTRVSVKDRLGFKKPCVKDRLGIKSSVPLEEEERLREKAIQSLDLRKRIAKPFEEDEDDSGSEESDVIVRSLVQKVKKDKKKKKSKKHRRRRSISEEDSPSGGETENHHYEEESIKSRHPAALALRDLKRAERKEKTSRKRNKDSEYTAGGKKTKKDSLFETAAREMESINEAISESNNVLKELEDLINN